MDDQEQLIPPQGGGTPPPSNNTPPPGDDNAHPPRPGTTGSENEQQQPLVSGFDTSDHPPPPGVDYNEETAAPNQYQHHDGNDNDDLGGPPPDDPRRPTGVAFQPIEQPDEGFTDVAGAVLESPTSPAKGGKQFESQRSMSVYEDGDSEDFDLPPPTTITSLRNNMAQMRFAKYLQEFDFDAKTEGVTMASIAASTIDENNRAQLLAAGIEKEDEAMQHHNDMDHIELLKLRRLHEMDLRKDDKERLHNRQLKEIAVKASLTEELLGTYFAHTAQELDIHLTARQAEVMQSVGEVRKFDRGDYDPDKPDWSIKEQQVEFRVSRIRGLKNKIPKGEYIMLISKWDKLGGNPMRWSNKTYKSRNPPPCPLHSESRNMKVRKNCEICQGWAGSSMPVFHSAGDRDYETNFESKMFTFFPSQQNIKPYMVLMFELVKLPKKRQGDPKVVGWGALPCVDSHFSIINGKFRFPLLRGPFDPSFNHHKSIQTAISDDIENWLGNCYIDVFPHPREHYGRHEFQLQSEFTNTLLNLDSYPSSKDGEGWPTDEKKRGMSLDEGSGLNKQFTMVGGMMVSMRDLGFEAMNGDGEDEDFPYKRPEQVEYFDTAPKTYWGIIRSAVLDVARRKKRADQARQREAVKRAEEQKQFRFSIHPHGAVNMQSVWRTQVEYCIRAILDEMSLRRSKRGFILNVIVFFIALYWQVYTHGCFLFFAISARNIPVDQASPKGYGLVVEYSQLNTTALDEVMITFLAQVANYATLLFLILVGWGLKRYAGQIPDNLSKFVYAVALGSVMVPWVELVVDSVNDTKYSDANRLHNYFTYHNYGGFYGYIIFILVYLFCLAGVFVSTFLYTMRLHLNGILQDAYWRILLVNEENFFIPEDLELSRRELLYILDRAERWRGKNGERRKIAVYNITTTDAVDDEYKRLDQYITIVQLDCGNSEEYFDLKPMKNYRQFYVMHDGAILESISRDLPSGMAFVLASIGQDGAQESAFSKLLAAAFKNKNAVVEDSNENSAALRQSLSGEFGSVRNDGNAISGFFAANAPPVAPPEEKEDLLADVDLGADDDEGNLSINSTPGGGGGPPGADDPFADTNVGL